MGKIVLIAVGALLVFIAIPIILALFIGRENTRDIIVIAWGILSILAFVMLIWLFAVIGMGVSRLVKDVRVIANEDVRPMLATTRESANNVTGTTRFVSDTVVSPIIRLYGLVAGIRRAIGVFTGLTRRGRRQKVT